MTRQYTRQIERAETKKSRSLAIIADRRAARNALLQRQTNREKADFYSRPVANVITPSRSRIHTRIVQKGKAYGRIIRAVAGMALHATKGWRIA